MKEEKERKHHKRIFWKGKAYGSKIKRKEK